MKGSLWFAGLLVALGSVWLYSQGAREPAAAARVPVAEKTASTPAAAPAAPASADAALVPPASAPQARAAVNPASSAAARKVFVTPELSRRLADAPAVAIGERNWTVLGTRDLGSGNAKQTILVLRDEASGQLDYRQSALRFVLNEGQDYESFIRSRSNATRLFANPLYGDIAVDASNIAAEYAALASDPRIAKVMFIPLEVRPVPK